MFLARFAQEVFLIHRRDTWRATAVLQQQARKEPKIKPIYNTVVEKIIGDTKVEALKLKTTKEGKEKIWQLEVDGVFVAIGRRANTEIVKRLVELDEDGYVKAENGVYTSTSGLFVAGDIAHPDFHQAVVAAGDGAKAALAARDYLKNVTT